MGKFDRAVAVAVERVGVGLPQKGEHRTSEQVAGFLELTHDDDPRVRQVAVRNLCPCHIQGDVTEVWDRLFEMSSDPDSGVRGDVLHTVFDGTPRHMRERALGLLETFRNDPDRRHRRGAVDRLALYRRTGYLTTEK
jgi:hypothetical protein